MKQIRITVTVHAESDSVVESNADDILSTLKTAEMDGLLDFSFETERSDIVDDGYGN